MQEQYCYKLLQLQPGASLAEVKAAYRKLVKKYHPDLNGNRMSTLKFTEIVSAYQRLILQVNPGVSSRREFKTHPVRRGFQTGKNRLYGTIAHFGRILLSSEEAPLRRNAAISLGNTGKLSAYGFLRRALWDPSPDVVLAVVKAIARLKVVQAGGELGAVFIKSGRQIKLAILDLARELCGYPGFPDILLLGLRDTDPVIKHYVIVEKQSGTWRAK